MLIFILGNAVIIRYLIAYAHLMEFVAQKQNLITGVFLFLDGLVYIYSPMFLMYIVHSTQYFVWIALGVSLFSIFLLGFIFHMPESLKYSLAKQDISKFENDMDYICEMNKATDAQRDRINQLVIQYCDQVRLAKQTAKAEKQAGQRQKISRLCRDKESFYNLALMMVTWVSTSFTYFLVIFLVKYLPGSLYMNQMVSGFSVIGYLIVPMLAPKFDNRRIMLMGYVISIVFLMAMLLYETEFLETAGEFTYSVIFFLFKTGVSMVFISLFVIHQDLFSTKFLATSYGLCNTVSRVATLAAPIAAEISNRAIPVGIMLALNVVALIAAYLLKLKDSTRRHTHSSGGTLSAVGS